MWITPRTGHEAEERYEAFIDEFTGLHPADGDAVLHDLTKLVHEWRRFPFLDPRLPPKLLPTGWRGARATELLRGWCGAARSA